MFFRLDKKLDCSYVKANHKKIDCTEHRFAVLHVCKTHTRGCGPVLLTFGNSQFTSRNSAFRSIWSAFGRLRVMHAMYLWRKAAPTVIETIWPGTIHNSSSVVQQRILDFNRFISRLIWRIYIIWSTPTSPLEDQNKTSRAVRTQYHTAPSAVCCTYYYYVISYRIFKIGIFQFSFLPRTSGKETVALTRRGGVKDWDHYKIYFLNFSASNIS
jgi:hypothetical protein